VAAEVAVSQGYVNAGQACYAVNRVLVPPALAGDLLERMRARIAGLELGPMATERGLARHRMLLDDARAAGARVEGGEELGGGRLAPALVTGAGPGVRLIDEEPFTPIVAVMELPDAAAAIAEANRPDYGLVGYVAGADLRGALEAAQATPAGRWSSTAGAWWCPMRPTPAGAARGWAPSWAGRAWRPSCAGSTCASWPRA
jgi:acyl-CoA reductase-like NAD-dependent aldehyde dehydrogenase